jgi:hypothetical protein
VAAHYHLRLSYWLTARSWRRRSQTPVIDFRSSSSVMFMYRCVRSRARLARLLGRESGSDLVVDDGSDVPDVATTPPEFSALIDRDPRVRAALAEVDAATFERQIFERLIRPPVTLGVDYGRQTRDIPLGSLVGTPFAGSLAANWTDAELVFNVDVPLPLFNRQREPRAQATGRLLTAEDPTLHAGNWAITRNGCRHRIGCWWEGRDGGPHIQDQG